LPDSYLQKKDLIKQSAARVFSHFGYHKCTMDDIADQIGIKKNTLYYYFDSKESIFNEILNDEVNALLNELKLIANQNTRVYKKLTNVFSKLLNYGKERSKVYSISLEIFIEIGEIINESFINFKKLITDEVAGILKNAIDTGEIKKHDYHQLADNLMETLRAFEYREYRSNKSKATVGEVELKDIEDRMNFITKIIIDGLK
jgi:TetR/AcrR family transcriptional regulator